MDFAFCMSDEATWYQHGKGCDYMSDVIFLDFGVIHISPVWLLKWELPIQAIPGVSNKILDLG